MSPHEIRPGVRRLFRLPIRRADDARDEADAEIRLHLQLRAEQLVREGMSPEAARAEAERRFGAHVDAALRASAERRERRLRARDWLAEARLGLRSALRALRRSPGFVVVAVTCIALGVGANAATFSVLDELLLRPLPVREPDRLVNLSAPGPNPGNDECNQAGECDEVFSLPLYRDLARSARSVVAGIAAHRLFLASVAADGRAAQGNGVFVSGSYFPLLGLAPALGRLLGPEDDVAPGAHPVAVLSHAYWTSQLGGDPAILGRQILVNGRSLTVVGVAPERFDGTTLGVRPWVYVPILMAAEVDPFFGPRSKLDDRTSDWTYLFARLRPGATIDGAHAALTAALRPILAEVDAPLHPDMSPATRARFVAREVVVVDGSHGQSSFRVATRTPARLLFAITALVVLIACANIANLLLVRGAARATEIAVRMSLGASRRQLVVQLLVESGLLAALGGVASLVVAYGTLRLVGSFLPAPALGFGPELSLALRPSVLAFAGGVSLATGLLFGLFPALHATRADLIASIRSGAGQIAGGHRAAPRFRTTLVTAQIAMSMALLGAAGLFVKSLRNIGRVDVGIATDAIVQFALLPELSGYDARRAQALLQRAEEEVGALPAVRGVAVSSTPLFTSSTSGGTVRVEGFVHGPDTDVDTRIIQVGPGFFRTMGIPLVAGRDLTTADRSGTAKVAVVNEAFARKFGLGTTALGKRLARGASDDGPLDIEIVGVARGAGYTGVKDEVPPLLYLPYRQDSSVTAAMLYVRAAGAPLQVLRDVPTVIARLDRNLPVPMLKPLRQQIRESLYLDRMIGALSAGFAALATLLAAVGLYGVLAYTVAQRTREIGVRMALGADAGRVRGMVLGQVGRMTIVGGVLGLAAALALGRAARSLLFGLAPHDPSVVIGAVVVLSIVALTAGLVPAVRAARIAPMRALRTD